MSRLRTLLLYNIIYCLPLRSLIHEFKAAEKNMMLWGRGGNMNCNAVHMRSIFPPADLYTPSGGKIHNTGPYHKEKKTLACETLAPGAVASAT